MGGSGWIRDQPRILERAFMMSGQIMLWFQPRIEQLGYARSDRWLVPLKEVSKVALFD